MPVTWNTPKDAGKDYENPMLSWLDKVNDNLENNPLVIVQFLNQISSEAEALSQDAVDLICEWSSCKVNREIERLRQVVIKALHKQYKILNIVLAPAQILYNFFKNPLGALVGLLKMVVAILKVLYAPVLAFIEFMADLAKEISRLAKNLSVIVNSLPPKPMNPKINFHKFKVDVGSIGMNCITDDPSNLPSPEDKFPQTAPTPFSKEFWDTVGDDARSAHRVQPTFITGTYEERMGIGVPQRVIISENDEDYFGEGIYSENEIMAKPTVNTIVEEAMNQAGQVVSFMNTTQGVKAYPSYNSTSGKKLASKARVTSGTVGYCLRGVKGSLSQAYSVTLDYLDEAWKTADALRGKEVTVTIDGKARKMSYPTLARMFTEVKNVARQSLKSLPAGSIVVWDRNVDDKGNVIYGGKGVTENGKKYGHVSIALGNGIESSDHLQDQITNRDAKYTVFIPT